MSKKSFIITLFGLLLALTIYDSYCRYIPKQAIYGVYLNVNFEKSPIFPNKFDKLTLYSNNTFKSESFGTGTYELDYSLKGTKINFEPDLAFGIDINTRINRTLTGIPRIVIFKDLGHYYIKTAHIGVTDTN